MRTHQSHRRAIRAHAGKRIDIDMPFSYRAVSCCRATTHQHWWPESVLRTDSKLVSQHSRSTCRGYGLSFHPMTRFRWWIVLNKKTYLIIAHSRDARDKEIKSCALDHELDELNTGNAIADRSSFGLQLCNSIQANDMEERCSFGIHIYNISRNTISFIYDSFTLHISKLSRNTSSFIWIWLHWLWSISDHQNA